MAERGTGIFRELHAAIVPVQDLARASAWYESVLELRPRRVVEGVLAVYGTSGPTHLCLYVPEAAGEGAWGEGSQASFPNWRSDDLDATRAHLVDHDVACSEIVDGGTLRFFTFHDPDGNRHDVCEYGDAWLP